VTALNGEHILLGVTGGIAAYKSAELVRRLKQAGADVRVVMSHSAEQFITATTMQALSGNPVRSSLWDENAEAAMSHIELARWASKVLVAPASADFIARLANGQANDLLSTLCLATTAPIYLAPSMNQAMWANVATKANKDKLQQRGVHLLGPASGEQACGEIGEGRMLEPAEIAAALQSSPKLLAGKKFLITAGPTFEDIDPVRFIGNRSSGKMGYAIAQVAREQGADVVLISGPVAISSVQGVRRVDVRSAQQMYEAVLAHLEHVDVFVSAAAVADYRPKLCNAQKIKKTESCLTVELERTVDILASVSNCANRPKLVLGFAAETERLDEYAQKKLVAKNLDYIAANDVSNVSIGFESEHNALVVFSKNGIRTDILHDTKINVANKLLAILSNSFKG
jgi:phosphopantothenoylcysteine decarboxylase/phosphopantothenate--cysteine ligase